MAMDAHTGEKPRLTSTPTALGSDRQSSVKGWTAVLVVPEVTLPAPDEEGVLDALLGDASTVSGPYGSGRLLETELLSVLLLDDGRLLAGAVEPDVLTEVAAGLGVVTDVDIDRRTTPDGGGTQSTRAAAIRTSGLTKRFGSQAAVDSLDLEVPWSRLRVPRPERVGQDHHDPDAARAGRRNRGDHGVARSAHAEGGRR